MKYVIEIEDKPLFYYDKDTSTYFPRVHKAIGFNTLVFDEEGLKRLTPIGMVTDAAHDDGYTKGYEQARFDFKKDIEDAYERGFKEGQESSEKWGVPYKRGTEDGEECGRICGMNDAWEAARKICCNPPVGLDYDTLNEIFGTRHLISVMAELSAGEVIDMIKTYEEKKKAQRDDAIRIGDIVRHKSVKNLTVYVTYISEETDQFCGLALNDVEDYCEAGDQYTTARLSAFEKTGAHKDIKEALKEMAMDMQ